MIYLILAAVCGALISIITRFSEKYISNSVGMLVVNYGMCIILACIFNGSINLFPSVQGLRTAIVLGFINGVLYFAGLLLLQWNITQNGVVLSATFMRLGVLVPIALSITILRENPGVAQVGGLVLAVIAIILMNLEKNKGKSQNCTSLLLLLFIGGFADFMGKIFELFGNAQLKNQFLFYAFGVALILCIALNIKNGTRIRKAEIVFGLFLGIPNYFSARCLLLAVKSISTIIVYPVYSIGGIVLVSIAGVFMFREKLGVRQKVSVFIILIALILLNI